MITSKTLSSLFDMKIVVEKRNGRYYSTLP